MACFANSVTLDQFLDFTASAGTSQEPPTQATLLMLLAPNPVQIMKCYTII